MQKSLVEIFSSMIIKPYYVFTSSGTPFPTALKVVHTLNHYHRWWRWRKAQRRWRWCWRIYKAPDGASSLAVTIWSGQSSFPWITISNGTDTQLHIQLVEVVVDNALFYWWCSKKWSSCKGSGGALEVILVVDLVVLVDHKDMMVVLVVLLVTLLAVAAVAVVHAPGTPPKFWWWWRIYKITFRNPTSLLGAPGPLDQYLVQILAEIPLVLIGFVVEEVLVVLLIHNTGTYMSGYGGTGVLGSPTVCWWRWCWRY